MNCKQFAGHIAFWMPIIYNNANRVKDEADQERAGWLHTENTNTKDTVFQRLGGHHPSRSQEA